MGRGRERLGWECFRPSSALVVRERITEKVTFTPRRKQRRMWAMLVTGRAFTTGVIRAKAWLGAAPSQDASWRCPFCFLLPLQFIMPSSSKPSLAQHRGTHSCDPRDETHYHFLDLSSWIPNKSIFSPVLSPPDKTILREAETNDMHLIYSAIIVYNYIKDAVRQRRSWRDTILAGRLAQALTFNTVLGVLRTEPRVRCLQSQCSTTGLNPQPWPLTILSKSLSTPRREESYGQAKALPDESSDWQSQGKQVSRALLLRELAGLRPFIYRWPKERRSDLICGDNQTLAPLAKHSN